MKTYNAQEIIKMDLGSVMLHEEEPEVYFGENGEIEWVEPKYSIVNDISDIF